MKTLNLTYKELIRTAPKDSKFKIRVRTNPYGRGGEQVLRARINGFGVLTTYFDGQVNIDGNDYAFLSEWDHSYTGTFDLILPEQCVCPHQKPEVYNAGDFVCRKCGQTRRKRHAGERTYTERALKNNL